VGDSLEYDLYAPVPPQYGHEFVVDTVERFLEDRSLAPEYDGYTACPILTEKGKAMIAEFDYEGTISAPVVSRLNWILDSNVIPSLYWNVWMRGYDPVP
jgi:sulfide:quinone oxidoreductase